MTNTDVILTFIMIISFIAGVFLVGIGFGEETNQVVCVEELNDNTYGLYYELDTEKIFIKKDNETQFIELK